MRPFGRLLLAVFAATAAATPRGAAREAAPPQLGDRSHAVYDLTCASELGRRQVTLFANGTIRLRDQVGKIAEMRLGELTRGELEGYLRRMAEEDLSEVDDTRLGPSGEWVEQCTLRLHLLEGEPRELRYSRYDSLPLALSRLTTMAEELAPRTLARGGYALPAGYRPQPGDLLRRADGVLFEVVAFTSDGKGVELQGVDQPLTVFARPEELPQQFVDLVSSRGP